MLSLLEQRRAKKTSAWPNARQHAFLRNNLTAYAFLAPSLVLLAIFGLYPLGYSFRLAFSNWSIFLPTTWVWFANFAKAFQDQAFLQSYINAVWYAVYTIPTGLVWALITALALLKIRGSTFFRMLYFLPSVTSGVAIAMMWAWIYNPDWGLLNNVLALMHLPAHNWLGNTNYALPAISAVVVWAGTGYWMIIFLAGLLDIPQEIYDAAAVDGAGTWHKFRRVTLPLLTPTIFYYVTIALMTVWTQFDLVYVMTGGGPANATEMPALQIYQEAFYYLNVSYAAALSWLLGLVTVLFVVLNFWVGKRWVHYER